MKKTLVAAMILGTVLVPSTAFAQSDDAPERTDQTRTTDVREVDQVRDRVDLEEAKARALEAIDKRVVALTDAIARIEANEHVEPEHARALIDDYEFHIRGLEALVGPIEEAETAEELRPLVESIVLEHWVFALQIPKGKLTVASDTILDATEHFDTAYARIENVLAELEEQGINLPGADALLEEARGLTEAAAELVSPIPDTVLAIAVEEMPEAREPLEAARADVRAAHDNLVQARENVREIVSIIKEALGTDAGTDAA